jgi:hypothetical protein
MGFAHFLKKNILGPLGVWLPRDSKATAPKKDKAGLRRSLRRLSKTTGALQKALDTLKKDNALQRQALAKTHKEIQTLADRFSSGLAEFGKSEKELKAFADRFTAEFAQLSTGLGELRQSVSDRIDASIELQQEFLALARHFVPRAAVGHKKVRLGREKTGGYVMFDDFDGVSAAFSFGVGDDAS